MADEPQRGFTGYWIPVEIVTDVNLRPVEKLLIAEIYALQKGDPRGCRASNEHLAKHVGMTAGSVANAITKLRRLGYIEDVSFDGRKRFVRAILLKASWRQLSSDDEGSIHHPMKINTLGNLLLSSDKSDSVTTQAEQIWQAYPKRIGKPAALRAIKAALAREGKNSFDKILAATKAFAKVRPDKRDQYTPWPQKWFSHARYNDEPHTWLPVAKPLTAVERNKRKGKLQEELNAMFRSARQRQQPGQPLFSEEEQQQRRRIKTEIEQL